MPHEKVFGEIDTECNRIDRLFQEYEPLLEKTKTQEPDFIEIGSLAMMLHSFYNGLESIFIRIAKKIDKNMPDGSEWHKELLDLMAKPTKKRKYAVLSETMCEELKVYLGFRHFSRHAYAFDLDWNLMKDLVLRADDVRKKVLGEMKSFIEKRKKEGPMEQ